MKWSVSKWTVVGALFTIAPAGLSSAAAQQTPSWCGLERVATVQPISQELNESINKFQAAALGIGLETDLTGVALYEFTPKTEEGNQYTYASCDGTAIAFSREYYSTTAKPTDFYDIAQFAATVWHEEAHHDYTEFLLAWAAADPQAYQAWLMCIEALDTDPCAEKFAYGTEAATIAAQKCDMENQDPPEGLTPQDVMDICDALNMLYDTAADNCTASEGECNGVNCSVHPPPHPDDPGCPNNPDPDGTDLTVDC